MTFIAIPAFAESCADIVRAAGRAADVRDAGVEQRMFLGMPETTGANAALLRALADVAYRYPRADGRTLAGMYRPACAAPAQVLTR